MDNKNFLKSLAEYNKKIAEKNENIALWENQIEKTLNEIPELEEKRNNITDIESGLKDFKELNAQIKEKTEIVEILKQKIQAAKNTPIITEQEAHNLMATGKAYLKDKYVKYAEKYAHEEEPQLKEVKALLLENQEISELIIGLVKPYINISGLVYPDHLDFERKAKEIEGDINRIDNYLKNSEQF